jgi:excisionase family DNA binding protein
LKGTELLSPRRVSEILGISKSHVYKMAKKGELPSIQFGRVVRFHPEDVDAFIKEHRRQKDK